MKLYPLLPAVLLAAACAKQPDAIPAAEIGTNEYRGYSCRQLSDAEVKYNQALENLSAAQRNAANGDAWGVFLLGLPLSSLSGNDKETAIAVTKGHLQSIDLEQQRRGCK